MLGGLVGLAILQLPATEIETVRQLSYRNNDLSVSLRRLKSSGGVFFQSMLSCDVDGSPNAYHPWDDNLALDTITSADGRRKGNLLTGPLELLPSTEVVVYVNGVPYIQPDGDYKGWSYLSKTSLRDPLQPATSPLRYLDARRIQYMVLPQGLVPEAELGDLAIVYDPISHRYATAVFGDIGPSSESGEASLATLQRLGLAATDGKSSPAESRSDLFFLVFPHSQLLLAFAEPWPHTQKTIDTIAEAEFARWGGAARIEAVLGAVSHPSTTTVVAPPDL